jgi:hypothetical protein
MHLSFSQGRRDELTWISKDLKLAGGQIKLGNFCNVSRYNTVLHTLA